VANHRTVLDQVADATHRNHTERSTLVTTSNPTPVDGGTLGLSTLRPNAIPLRKRRGAEERFGGCDMTDREKLLTALLQESDRRAGAEISLVDTISIVDVIAVLERLGAEHQRVVHHKVVATAA
jgi:hypothetical protein